MNKIFDTMKAAVFDMDGTLLDSMPMWHTVSDKYLEGKGIQPPAGLWDNVKRLTEIETANYFISNFGIKDPIERICADFRSIIAFEYHNKLQLKDGAKELLQHLNSKGIPCVLATATNRPCVDACLARLGIAPLFTEVLTCLELDTTKKEPLIFERAAEICGALPSEAVIFEDALHCIRTAKNAGFAVCAVYDKSSDEITEPPESDWDRIKKIADCTVNSLTEIIPQQSRH